MDKLIDDLFHAQPDALFMIAGLLFIAIAVVGSVKTYIDPGKFGRIAAGVIGVILVVVGFRMYGTAPAAAVATSPATPVASGPVSTLCKFARGPKAGTTHDFTGKSQPLRVGSVCRDGQGSEGFVVAADTK